MINRLKFILVLRQLAFKRWCFVLRNLLNILNKILKTNPDMFYLLKMICRSTARLECKTTNEILNVNTSSKTAKSAANNKVFKTLRLAFPAQENIRLILAEQKQGALAGMNATMTRVNGVFNRDLAVKLVLIANTNAVIYTDAATDPYSDAAKGTSEDQSDGNDYWSKEVQEYINNRNWRCEL